MRRGNVPLILLVTSLITGLSGNILKQKHLLTNDALADNLIKTGLILLPIAAIGFILNLMVFRKSTAQHTWNIGKNGEIGQGKSSKKIKY